MKILALDSATAACSAAVWIDDGVVAHRFDSMSRGHAERLMPMVRDVMAESDITFGDLDFIATTTGPGGFTGLRVGLAAARALALAAKIPIFGYTTLEVVARSPRIYSQQILPVPRPLLVVLDAKRTDYYFQLFHSDRANLTEPATASPTVMAAVVATELGVTGTSPDDPLSICGDGADAVIEKLRACGVLLHRDGGPDAPDAAVLASLAHADASDADANEAAFGIMSRPPEPLYLRAPDAALPRR